MTAIWRTLAVSMFVALTSAQPACAWDEVWQSMAGGTNGSVRASVVFEAGLVAAGDFTIAGGLPANRIARYNGGGWQALGAGMNDSINAIVLFNGELVAGGRFTTADGAPANRIARWNGTTWQQLGNGMDGDVFALTVFNGELIAGGAFTMAGGVPAARIARWNGASWQSVGSGMSGGTSPAVHALHVFNNELIAGGTFTIADGVTVNRIARWNGSVWQALGSGVSGFSVGVFAFSVYQGELIAGGSFLVPGVSGSSGIARWNGSSWQSLGSGIQSSTVRALSAYNGELIAGGDFNTAGDVPGTNRIARWNGTEWRPSLGVGMDEPIRTLVIWNEALVAGGDFPLAGGQNVNFIALTTANSTQASCAVWQPIGSGFNSSSSALAIYNGDLYAGGLFTTAGGVPASRIARWDGIAWHPVGNGMTGTSVSRVRALVVYGGELIAGGDFSNVIGTPNTSGIARWNGSTWQSLGTGMGGAVYALTIFNGELIATGSFTTAGGVAANRIARWNGSTWQTLGGGLNTGIASMLGVYNNELYVSGGFTVAGGVPANLMAKWNGSNWQAVGGGLGGGVAYALIEYNSELILGGLFTSVDGVAANRIARWDGANWHPFGNGMNGHVESLYLYNGDIIAGGGFTSPANRIARWTGSSWQPLSSGMTDTVGDIIEYNGAMIAVGGFTTAGGAAGTDNIARWSPNIWLTPASGVFTSARNWEFGYSPDSTVQFGSAPSAASFAVTLRSFAQSPELCIVNQSPAFNLGGNDYEILNHTTIGPSQTASLTVNAGTLISPIVDVGSFGALGGNGTITGNVFSVGTVQPGSSPSAPGTLSVTGNYQQTYGLFNPVIGAAQHGRMNVTGSASIAGTLRVELAGNPTFSVGQEYPVLTCGTRNGTFDVALMPFIGDDLVMNVQYDQTADTGDGLAGVAGSGVVIVVGQPGGNPDFGGPDTFSLAGEPTAVASAAVTGLPVARDLALSVAAPLPTDPGNVLLLLNSGDGSSFDPLVIPVGRQPSGMVVAALADGSTHDDLAVPNKGDDTVSVLFHDGGGAFTVVNVPVGDAPSAIAAGDFRNIGVIDLVVANSGSHTITVLRNNGDRTFTPQTPISVGNTPSAIAAAELDDVPGVDMVVANAGSNNVMFFRNFGSGAFGAPTSVPVGPTPSSVEPADIENDKDFDLVVGNAGGGTVALLVNNGDGNFGSATNLPVDGDPVASAGALSHWDMDADADNDLVVVVNDDQLGPVIRILRNDSNLQTGQIAFTLFEPIGQGELPRLVHGADVTGDLAEDLVAVNVQQLSLAGTSSNSLTIRPNLAFKKPIGPGDVNGDGFVNIDDLLVVVNGWGPCPASPIVCPADVHPLPTGNDVVDIDDLLQVVNHWSPPSAN